MKITESSVLDDVRYIHDQLAKFNASKNGNKSLPVMASVPGRTALTVRNGEGKIVAGLVYRILDDHKTAYVDFLWVSDELRGQGTGKNLLQYMKDKAATLNCSKIQLYTVAWQAPEFYKKMGFTLTNTSPWENTTRFDYEFSLK